MKNVLYIIDDHNMVRNGLKMWLEKYTDWKAPHDFSNGSDCMTFLNQLAPESPEFPEILIIDVQLIGETGLNLQKM